MSTRGLCAASTVVLLFLIASPASAKPWHVEGFRELRAVELSGPGMSRPRVLDGDTQLARTLLRHSGLHLALLGREPLSTAAPPLARDRGPRYVVEYRLTAKAGAAYRVEGGVVRQYLYPYADERPWAYVPTGQGPDAARRWWPASIQLVALYPRLGLPRHRQIDVTQTGAGAAGGSPAPAGTGGPDGGTWVALALAGVLLVAGFRRRLVGGTTRRA